MSIAKPAVEIPWADEASAGDAFTPPDIVEPSDALKHTGFTLATPAPPYNVVNWLFARAIGIGTYLMARGIPDWSVDEDYTVGDVCQYPLLVDETHDVRPVYRAKAACKGVPCTDTTYWEIFGTNGNWLADALKDRLVATLPGVSDFIVAMLEACGVAVHLVEDGTTHLVSGYFRVRGLQVNFFTTPFTMSGGFPIATAVTWGSTVAAGCTGLAGAYVAKAQGMSVAINPSVTSLSATGVTLDPQPTAGHTFSTAPTAFVLAIGGTPST